MFNVLDGECKLLQFNIEKDLTKRHYDNYGIVAEYIQETDTKIMKHVIKAPLYLRDFPVIEITYEPLYYDSSNTNIKVDLGFGELKCAEIISTVIEEKTKKMTIQEIEKALGHKIKIIGGTSND